MKAAEAQSLTGNEANEIIEHFVPKANPFHVKNLGVWYAGGDYYKLRRYEDGTNYITRSPGPDEGAPQFYVKRWRSGEMVTNDDSFTAIADHAKSYRELVMANAVLKKVRHRDENKGRDVYYSPHQTYQADFLDHQVNGISKSIVVGKNSHGTHGHSGILIWPQNGRESILGIEAMTRKSAELFICEDFVHSLKRTLSTHSSVDPELREKHPAHYYFGQAKRILSQLRRKMFPSLEKIDAGLSIKENIIWIGEAIVDGPFHRPISTAWKVVATLLGARSISKREDEEKWPGCVSPKDSLAREFCDIPDYAYPLGGFSRPMKKEVLDKSTLVSEPVFGPRNLFNKFTQIPSFESDGMEGLTELYYGPTIGSTVRFYVNQNAEKGDVDSSQSVGAIKIFRPDGLTITIFEKQTHIWISFEPERCFDTDNSSIPQSLRDRLASANIVELAQRKGGPQIKSLDYATADRIFRKEFGGAFRTPHRELTPEQQIREPSAHPQ